MISTSRRTTNYRPYSASKTTRSATKHRAATRIQTAVRGYLVRKNMNKMSMKALLALAKKNPNMVNKVLDILAKRRKAANNAMAAKYPRFFGR